MACRRDRAAVESHVNLPGLVLGLAKPPSEWPADRVLFQISASLQVMCLQVAELLVDRRWSSELSGSSTVDEYL